MVVEGIHTYMYMYMYVCVLHMLCMWHVHECVSDVVTALCTHVMGTYVCDDVCACDVHVMCM